MVARASKTYRGNICRYHFVRYLDGYRNCWNVIQNYSIYCSIRPISRLALVEVTYKTGGCPHRSGNCIYYGTDLYKLILEGSESALIYTKDDVNVRRYHFSCIFLPPQRPSFIGVVYNTSARRRRSRMIELHNTPPKPLYKTVATSKSYTLTKN